MKIKKKEVMAALATGLPLYYVTVFTVGVASAIAMPESYKSWVEESGHVWIGMQIWNTLTLYPALLIPIAIAIVMACSLGKLDWRHYCGSLVLIYVCYFYADTAFNLIKYPSYITLNGWRALVPSFTVIGTVWLTGYLHNKVVNRVSTECIW